MLTQRILLSTLGAVAGAAAEAYTVPRPSGSAGEPFDGYVSYSIEFSSFPDFAGNKSSPNTYSDNLLDNLGALAGTKPYIRVGGNTQDFALYNASLDTGLVGIVDPDKSPDYPTTIHIGPSFFESYGTWAGVRFSHGFNMGLGGSTPEGWRALVDTVPLACRALPRDRLNTWEYGNEPDLFSVASDDGAPRPASWNESTYVWQWHNATREIRRLVREACPEQAAEGEPTFMAPSHAGVENALSATVEWEAGLNKDKDIEYFSTHNYISGAETPGVTLQGTLMNHTSIKESVDAHIAEYENITALSGKQGAPPLIFGETNSLYHQGRPGLSNTFGAALWGIDFNLYSASVGFKRVHMHMGTNYRYQAWQPISTDLGTIGTKAPYYGSIAVAATIGDNTRHPVSISSIPLSSDPFEAAYAAQSSGAGGELARILVINMHSYNTTVDGGGLEPVPDPAERPSRTYTFAVDGVADGGEVGVQRLLANGSDAITGVTFDGWSYNWELDEGRPVRLDNVTVGETAEVRDGEVSVDVPDSSAVLLNFSKKH